MKRTGLFVIMLVFMLSIPTVCSGATDWRTLKTEYFTVFYPSGVEQEAREILEILEFYRPEVEKLTGNRQRHLPIVLDDLGVSTNGLANPLLYNIHLFWYPPTAGLLGTVEDWYTIVAIHEYTHILQMTNVGRGPKVFCSLFGNIFSPNVWVPGWVLEGITVYSESRLFNYQGRLNDGKFDAYIGARVADNRFPSILDATFSPHEFHLEGIYTYGGLFFNYLAQTYGEEKLTEFFTVHGSSWASLDKNTQTVFGKTFPQLWADWKDYETERFKDYSIDGQRVTTDGWYVSNPVIAESDQGEQQLFYRRVKMNKTGPGRGFSRAEIIARDLLSQEEEGVVTTTSSFNLPIKVRNQSKLYYGVEEMKPGYTNALNLSYGVYAQIREKDLRSGRDRLVLAGDIRAYELLPDGSILYSTAVRNDFGSQIYRYKTGEGSKLLYEVPYLIDEMVADEERIIFSARKKGENNDLYLFSLATGELTPLVTTPYGEYGISLTGDQLFFHANYQEVYGVYCYDLTTAQVYKMTTGNYATQPAYEEKGEDLYFVGLNSYGFDLYRHQATFTTYNLPDAPPESWPLGAGKGNVEDIKHGGYGDNLATLVPKMMAPQYFTDGDDYMAGLVFIGSDAIGHIPSYQIGLNYVSNSKRWEPNALITLNLFPPFLLNFGYQPFEDRPLALDLNYPFYNRLSPGLSEISLGLACSYGQSLGAELVPYTAVGFRYPGTKLNLQLQMPVEDPSWGSSERRVGYYGALEANQLLLNGELTLKVQGFSDPDQKDDVFPRIRGYQKRLAAKRGAVSTLEYSHPLLRLGTGSWLLSLYLEDLYTSFFVEAAVPDEGEYQLSYGVELYQEMRFDYGAITVPLNPGVGVGFNRDGERYVAFILKFL